MKLAHKKMLEGFVPYDSETIKKYTLNGAWENLTYGDLLDRTVVSFPDQIAVVDDRSRLTYRELKTRVDRFALALDVNQYAASGNVQAAHQQETAQSQ